MTRRRQPKRYPATSIERAVELYLREPPVTMLNIEAATGADAKTIRQWVKDAGHPLRKPGRRVSYDQDALRIAVAKHGSIAAAARATGRDRETLRVAMGDRGDSDE